MIGTKATLTVRDEVWCFITGLTPTHLGILYDKFGVFVDGYFFMPAYKLGNWSGKIRFFEKTGKTYVRLLDQVLPYLENWSYEIELIDNRKVQRVPELRASNLLFGDIEFGGKQFELRPYQVECINTAIEAGSGFIVAGTGSGKCVSGSTLINIKATETLKKAIEHVRRKKLSHLQDRK